MAADTRAAEAVDVLTRQLREAATPSGGWAYYVGKTSRVEPTCWALLALHGAASKAGAPWHAFAGPHLAFLTATQTGAGALSDTGGATTNLASDGLAATVLPYLADTTTSDLIRPLLRAIVGTKGIKGESDPRQDNSLQAWPWYPDTFSWVEPTAWCTLALKKAATSGAPDIRARIDEAERMLENRCCDGGGWNYGNASVIGQDLRPHVPPTAIALIALPDRGDRPYVRRSVDLLERARFKEQSSLALGLATIALHLHGRRTEDVQDRLGAICPRAADRGDVLAMAVALCALTVDQHDAKALRVG